MVILIIIIMAMPSMSYQSVRETANNMPFFAEKKTDCN